MNVDSLAELVSSPEVLRSVLGDYSGAVHLGVTRLHNDDAHAALDLKVEDGNAEDFPSEIKVQGETVPVLVDVNWKAPTPQPSRAPVKLNIG